MPARPDRRSRARAVAARVKIQERGSSIGSAVLVSTGTAGLPCAIHNASQSEARTNRHIIVSQCSTAKAKRARPRGLAAKHTTPG
jgi:uncharacterized metal-binding protein